MSRTPHLDLPLVAAAQAQKHVTVNEALSALDATVHLSALSATEVAPPSSPVDGDRYVVGSGATGDWSGRDAQIALFQNGGWLFLAPKPGWRAWLEDRSAALVFDGAAWGPPPLTAHPKGAATLVEIAVADQTLSTGTVLYTADLIPAGALVLAVSARVLEPVMGVGSFHIGVVGDANRYGHSLDVASGTTSVSVGEQHYEYTQAQRIRFVAGDGSFAGGRVRVAAHFLRFTPPSAD